MVNLKKNQLNKIKNFTLNFGPQHPAAHGVLRLILELNGETVKKADPHIGLLHRGTEKLIESKTYLQSLPYFNRLDYVSMMSQEHTYVLALERLLNISVSKRVQTIRVLFAELTRILNHLLAVGCHAMDVGAMTPFLWAFEEREKLMEFYEQVSGARMHSAYFRIGQVAKELPENFLTNLYYFCKSFLIRLSEISEMLDENRIWKQRLVDIGIVPISLAEDFGFSGVMLRGSGLSWDLRKTQPYDIYSELNFNIVVGTNGDCYSRYLVRLHEMYESVSLIEQCIKILIDAPLQENITNKLFQPSRFKMKQSMEDLIQHFKYFSDNISLTDIDSKDFYLNTEAPKGEFGVYLYALKDNKNLYRCKIKSPGYMHLQSLNEMSKGHLIADVVTIIGTQDIVFGEIDR